MNVAGAPNALHKDPAMTLASKRATPLTKLKIPKAVPRSPAGAVSATSFDSNPWVKAMCRPQNAAPRNTIQGEAATANTTSAVKGYGSALTRCP